ncbi:Transcriptional activator spt7, partial [Lobosporangium transversale]
MSLFSREPLAEGESEQPYNATSLPSSPMSILNFESETERMDTNLGAHDTFSSSSIVAVPSSEQREKLLKILNDSSSNGQIRLTYNVAQEMNTRKLWRFYLTEEEHEVFEAALTSLDTWHNFISLDSKFGSQFEDIKKQHENQQQLLQLQQQLQHQLATQQHSDSQSTQNVPSASISQDSVSKDNLEIDGETKSEGADNRVPDIIKVDQDRSGSDFSSVTIKKEDFSAQNSPSVSTPSVTTPNGHLRAPNTPNHRARSPSPRNTMDSQLCNGSSPQPESTSSFPSTSTSESNPIPVSIPTTAFRTRVMVFEQLLPKIFPARGGCCHPTVDVFALEKKGVLTQDKGRRTSVAIPYNTDSSSRDAGSQRRIVEDDNYDEDTDMESKKDIASTSISNDGTSASAPSKDNNIKDKKSGKTPIRLPIHHLYYTLEYDMDAMIEQQQLEEADKNIQQEQESQTGTSLITDNMLTQLGTGSLSMKYLLGAIEANRSATGLTDRELRTLLSDVRPNRSKWANEDKVGQEELYEGCERVLMELRNYTEHSTPFLNKVNKREAPDYFQVIKHPMDLGTVLKKLKSFAYQSKTQFANDLYLIYSNCLLYNSDPSSVYRKHAIAMKKKTQQLLETVQDVVIRDRAEVEAEAEESDDDVESQAGRPNESSKGMGRKDKSSKTVHKTNGESSSHTKDHSSKRGATAVPLGSETPKMAMDLDTMANSTPTREASREPSTMDSIEAPMLSSGSFERASGLGWSGTPNGIIHSSPARHRMARASVPVEIDLEQEEREIAEQLRADRGDLLFQEWKEKTKKARAKICSTRESQQQLPFGDHFALERSPWEMKKSREIDLAHENVFHVLLQGKQKKKKNKKKGRGFGLLDNNGTFTSTDAEEDKEPLDPYEDIYDDSDSGSEDDDEEDYVRDLFAPPKPKEEEENQQKKVKKMNDIFLPEYAIRSGLPEIPGAGCVQLDDHEQARKLFDESEISKLEEKQPSLSLYPTANATSGQLAVGIERNIEELRKIRHVYTKIFTAKATISEPIQIEEPMEPMPIPPYDGPLPPLVMNHATGNAMLSRVASKLLAHAGFQGAQASALAVMTDIAVEFFLNIGKTLRGYSDLYNKGMTAEEILLHTLYENGVSSVGELEGYIREDVERYGNKLQEVHRKLESSYTDTINNIHEEVIDTDFEFQENDEAFMSGNLIGGVDELGDDFFGFREMGIDREVGLSSLAIPARIWYGGIKNIPYRPGIHGIGPNKGKDPAKQELPYPPPPPFTPLTDPTETIGLLHPFFKKRMEELGSLLEDEFMPVSRRVAMRPKIPPTGKIVSSMKNRANKPGELSALAEAKKRKRKKEKDAQEAERAERKRQKQDAKDKKMQERMEKKKMKEESKLKEKLTKPTKK